MENVMIKGDFKVAQMQEERYLNFLDVSERTYETYKTGIEQFIIYLQEKKINTPTRDDVLDFKKMLVENYKVSTVNTYLIALRGFFKFLSYKGIYPNITENIKSLVDTDLHKREALSNEECLEILKNVKDLREKALFVLTLTCGLRANEIVNIRLQDFKEMNGNNVLYVLGKGRKNKVDYVVVPEQVFEILQEYVEKYEINDYLFVSTSANNKGNQMATCSVRRMVNKMYERVGLKRDTITLHSLRHTFATMSIENGENIREVSQALRHKSITTTNIYLHDLEMKNNNCSNVVSNKILGIL